jgi:hypothetical protein
VVYTENKHSADCGQRRMKNAMENYENFFQFHYEESVLLEPLKVACRTLEF